MILLSVFYSTQEFRNLQDLQMVDFDYNGKFIFWGFCSVCEFLCNFVWCCHPSMQKLPAYNYSQWLCIYNFLLILPVSFRKFKKLSLILCQRSQLCYTWIYTDELHKFMGYDHGIFTPKYNPCRNCQIFI